MNDIIDTIAYDSTLTPDELAALMAKLHAADDALASGEQSGGSEASSPEGEVVFVAEDSASQPSGTIH